MEMRQGETKRERERSSYIKAFSRQYVLQMCVYVVCVCMLCKEKQNYLSAQASSLLKYILPQ